MRVVQISIKWESMSILGFQEKKNFQKVNVLRNKLTINSSFDQCCWDYLNLLPQVKTYVINYLPYSNITQGISCPKLSP